MTIEKIRENIEIQMESLRIEWRRADEVMSAEHRRDWRAGIQHSLNQLTYLVQELDKAEKNA